MRLLITLIFISNFIYSQQLTPIKASRTAGDELIMAKKHYYTGIGFVAIGGLISIMAANSVEAGTINPTLITGGVFGLIGAILTFESFSHIGKAGIILNQNKSITLAPSDSGIGIKMRF